MGKLRLADGPADRASRLHDLARGGRRIRSPLSMPRSTAHYAIECDLHISADGVPVVFHDDDLERLTGEQRLRPRPHGRGAGRSAHRRHRRMDPDARRNAGAGRRPGAACPRAEARSRPRRRPRLCGGGAAEGLCRAGGADVVRSGADRRGEGRRSQSSRAASWPRGDWRTRTALFQGRCWRSASTSSPTPSTICRRRCRSSPIGCSASR